MRLESGNIIVCLMVAAAFLLWGAGPAWAPPSITCGTNGDFGTVNTQATITGPQNVVMSTTGAITYPGTMNGPATGTPVTCSVAGYGNNDLLVVDCDASRTIANTGGSYGDTNRSMTAFSVKAVGNTTGGPATCSGLGGSGTNFRATAAGTGTITLGATMDATHAKIGGSYKLSNHATGPVNVQVKKGGVITGPATADFTIVFAGLLSISATQDMDFGSIGYSSIGASEFAKLGTNGSVVYGGSFSGGPTKTPGSVTVNNVQNGVTLEIYCDSTATLAKSGASGSTIQVTAIEAAKEGNTSAHGSGAACNGVGGAAATTMVFTSGTVDQFFLGGKLDGATAASFATGSYSTANAGGDDIQVIVVNQ